LDYELASLEQISGVFLKNFSLNLKSKIQNPKLSDLGWDYRQNLELGVLMLILMLLFLSWEKHFTIDHI
jgi:hypothetical protein